MAGKRVQLGALTITTRVPGDVVSTARIGIKQEIRNAKVSGTKTPRERLDTSGPTVTPRTFPPTPLVR